MNIKKKNGFITIYVMISMVFLITIITISLIMASRKLRNQEQINSEIYKMYNKEDTTGRIIDYTTEIPIYNREHLDNLNQWIQNGGTTTVFMQINGYLYKLDSEKVKENTLEGAKMYKANLKNDLYFYIKDIAKVSSSNISATTDFSNIEINYNNFKVYNNIVSIYSETKLKDLIEWLGNEENKENLVLNTRILNNNQRAIVLSKDNVDEDKYLYEIKQENIIECATEEERVHIESIINNLIDNGKIIGDATLIKINVVESN